MTISTCVRCGLLGFSAVGFVTASSCGVSAREASTFLISAAQGYGVEDCLAEGGECGRVVADAWCEAHGGGEALKFGRSEGENAASGVLAETRPYFITCGD
jgi:hypothetical protein